MPVPQTILVTGASSGFGALTARLLALAGHTVYASMHSPNEKVISDLATFSKEHKADLRPLTLDVVNDVSCKDAIASILKDTGHLDCIVHNAGHMGYGPAEAFSAKQFLDYYDVNCVGPQRVNKAALPSMRERGKGLLLWVGSTSTRGGTPPFLAPYFAAKAAMDSLAVSYSTELSRFGIETTIMVPGAFTGGTNHFANAGKPEDGGVEQEYFGKGGKYEGMSERVLKALSGLEPEWADVNVVGEKIVEVVGMEHGSRPFRVHVDPSNDGAETVNAVAELAKNDFYQRLGLQELLHVSK